MSILTRLLVVGVIVVAGGVMLPESAAPTLVTVTYGGGGPVEIDLYPPTVTEPGASGARERSTAASTPTPSRTAGPSPTPGPGIDREQLEALIHEGINEERTDEGLRALSRDPGLREIARAHSRDMAEREFFSHTNPSGQRPGDRYEEHGYNCRVEISSAQYIGAAENIYRLVGFMSEEVIAEEVVSGWMASPGHRENILTPAFRNEGIGVAVAEDGAVYVTQNLC